MKSYELLLKDNKQWAAKKLAEDPGFFRKLLHVQSPEFLMDRLQRQPCAA